MSTQPSDLVTAEGLKKAMGGMSAEPGARVELYSNPNASSSNRSATLAQSMAGFRYLEITLVSGSGEYQTALIPVSKMGTAVVTAFNGSTLYKCTVSGSGTSLRFGTYDRGGIVLVVGIV